MKKRIVTILLVLIMMLCLVGCGKKPTVRISVDGIGDYNVTQVSREFKNYSVDSNNVINVTLKKEGVFPFVLMGEDGKEYSFTLSYDDGVVRVSTEDDITINMEVED